MKTVYMFVTSWCPYCKQALHWMKQLQNKNSEYRNIDIKIIDEERHPKIAKKFDYYYVPTYFVGESKVHEGVPSKKIIEKVFEKALEKE